MKVIVGGLKLYLKKQKKNTLVTCCVPHSHITEEELNKFRACSLRPIPEKEYTE